MEVNKELVELSEVKVEPKVFVKCPYCDHMDYYSKCSNCGEKFIWSIDLVETVEAYSQKIEEV